LAGVLSLRCIEGKAMFKLFEARMIDQPQRYSSSERRTHANESLIEEI
jgi:hypothetical protein